MEGVEWMVIFDDLKKKRHRSRDWRRLVFLL